MIGWSLGFLAIALIAAILGFNGSDGASVAYAQILFFIALALSAASFVVALVRGKRIH